MLHLIDKLAGRWLDWRTAQSIKANVDLAQFRVERLDVDDDSLNLAISHPAVAEMADIMSTFLLDHNAENYVEFDMIPRIDRGSRPVRVTVQWADGMPPSEMVDELKAQLAATQTELDEAEIQLDKLQVASSVTTTGAH